MVGPQSYHRLPELVQQASAVPARSTRFARLDKFGALPGRRAPRQPSLPPGRLRQILHLLRRPYTRGAEISRPWNDWSPSARTGRIRAREIVLLDRTSTPGG